MSSSGRGDGDSDRAANEFAAPERVSSPADTDVGPSGEPGPVRGSTRLVAPIAFVAFLVTLALAWRLTPLRDYLNVAYLASIGSRLDLASNPLAPLVVLAAYLVGGLLVIPLTVLIAVTGLVFGPLAGGIYALTCATLASIALYLAGRTLGRDTLRRISGRRVNELSRRLASRGALSVFLVRLLPIAPFTIVNLAAGASHIRLLDFVIGTIAGLLPCTVFIVFVVDRVVDAVDHPGWSAYAIVACAAGTAVAILTAINSAALRSSLQRGIARVFARPR